MYINWRVCLRICWQLAGHANTDNFPPTWHWLVSGGAPPPGLPGTNVSVLSPSAHHHHHNTLTLTENKAASAQVSIVEKRNICKNWCKSCKYPSEKIFQNKYFVLLEARLCLLSIYLRQDIGSGSLAQVNDTWSSQEQLGSFLLLYIWQAPDGGVLVDTWSQD